MREFEALDHSVIVEMLLHQTEKLTHLLRDKEYSNEYSECKKIIEELTDEIRLRQQNPNRKK